MKRHTVVETVGRRIVGKNSDSTFLIPLLHVLSSSVDPGSGHRRMTAIVGLALFTQYWYWFPMTHFIGLAFRPAALIAVNKNLKMPELELKCNAKPSLFAYPPMGPPEKPKTDAKAPVAVLSVTAKAMARETRRERKKAAGASSTHEAMEVDSSAEKDTKEAAAETPKERTEEPSSFMISNPSRVLDEQEKCALFTTNSLKVCQNVEPFSRTN